MQAKARAVEPECAVRVPSNDNSDKDLQVKSQELQISTELGALTDTAQGSAQRIDSDKHCIIIVGRY
ncbi:putative Cell division control protein 45 like protein [Fusarium oxysporum f. sp. albedinis]|nr:putative Cell division control protein 45 like protein [Fusarium oxysporum f. sp. albedinis]